MRSVLASLLLALPLLACSGGDNTVDAGPHDGGSPLAAFGLETGNCYEFSNTAASVEPPALGVAVEDLSAESSSNAAIWYLPDGGSSNVQAISVVYRQVGQRRMTDSLFINGEDVLLLKRDVADAEEIEYHPALILTRLPLKNADHLDQLDGGIREFGGDGGDDLQPYAFTFDVTEQTLPTPANSVDGGFDAFTYFYSGGPSRLSSWSFTPSVGLVQVSAQFPGDNTIPTYSLQGMRQLTAGDTTCGSTPQP